LGCLIFYKHNIAISIVQIFFKKNDFFLETLELILGNVWKLQGFGIPRKGLKSKPALANRFWGMGIVGLYRIITLYRNLNPKLEPDGVTTSLCSPLIPYLSD
jgi:hypothetical protein